MSITEALHMAEQLAVPELDDPMFSAAVNIIQRQAVDHAEFEEFMSALAPEQWRCHECDQAYVVQSLARMCEEKHRKGTK